jgi:hypothetical protein
MQLSGHTPVWIDWILTYWVHSIYTGQWSQVWVAMFPPARNPYLWGGLGWVFVTESRRPSPPPPPTSDSSGPAKSQCESDSSKSPFRPVQATPVLQLCQSRNALNSRDCSFKLPINICFQYRGWDRQRVAVVAAKNGRTTVYRWMTSVAIERGIPLRHH